METITSGVHQVGGYVNAFVVDGDQGVVLVDTGLPKKEGMINRVLEAIGRAPEDVVAILLTHSHADHMGGAAALKQTTGAPLFASNREALSVQGDEPIPPPPMFSGFLSFIPKLMPSPPNAEVDNTVSEDHQDGMPDDFTVIDTPGHTPGHTSYLLERNGGIVFTGDAAAVNKDGSLGVGFFNRGGKSQIRDSIRHISERTFEMAMFGHSPAITSGADQVFRAFHP